MGYWRKPLFFEAVRKRLYFNRLHNDGHFLEFIQSRAFACKVKGYAGKEKVRMRSMIMRALLLPY